MYVGGISPKQANCNYYQLVAPVEYTLPMQQFDLVRSYRCKYIDWLTRRLFKASDGWNDEKVKLKLQ